MRRLKGQSDVYRPMTMVAQVADVKSTLVSVHRLLEAGNKVHFEPGNCYVEHIRTRVKTKIVEKNGAFEVGFWAPRAREDTTKGRVDTTKGTDNQGVKQMSFARQDS